MTISAQGLKVRQFIILFVAVNVVNVQLNFMFWNKTTLFTNIFFVSTVDISFTFFVILIPWVAPPTYFGCV